MSQRIPDRLHKLCGVSRVRQIETFDVIEELLHAWLHVFLPSRKTLVCRQISQLSLFEVDVRYDADCPDLRHLGELLCRDFVLLLLKQHVHDDAGIEEVSSGVHPAVRQFHISCAAGTVGQSCSSLEGVIPRVGIAFQDNSAGFVEPAKVIRLAGRLVLVDADLVPFVQLGRTVTPDPCFPAEIVHLQRSFIALVVILLLQQLFQL